MTPEQCCKTVLVCSLQWNLAYPFRQQKSRYQTPSVDCHNNMTNAYWHTCFARCNGISMAVSSLADAKHTRQSTLPPIQGPVRQCTSGHTKPERATVLLPRLATPAHLLLLQLALRLHLLLRCQAWSVCWRTWLRSQTSAGPLTCV